MNTDKVRAAIISLVQSFIPVLQLAGVVHLTSDGVAVIMLFVTNAVTMAFLLAPNPKALPTS